MNCYFQFIFKLLRTHESIKEYTNDKFTKDNNKDNTI